MNCETMRYADDNDGNSFWKEGKWNHDFAENLKNQGELLIEREVSIVHSSVRPTVNIRYHYQTAKYNQGILDKCLGNAELSGKLTRREIV